MHVAPGAFPLLMLPSPSSSSVDVVEVEAGIRHWTITASLPPWASVSLPVQPDVFWSHHLPVGGLALAEEEPGILLLSSLGY